MFIHNQSLSGIYTITCAGFLAESLNKFKRNKIFPSHLHLDLIWKRDVHSSGLGYISQ
jgi:hypothetical protein